MKIYDRLAGKLGLSPSELLSPEETLRRIPTLETEGLQRGVCYYDGQFDDARLAINLAQTIFDLGGTAVNYMQVVSLIKHGELLAGAVLRDLESSKEYDVHAKAVVNATSVFADGIRRLDEPGVKTVLAPSQGTHLVLPKSFLPGDSAIMVPNAPDGRVLFAVPWHDHAVIGTTDLAVDDIALEPVATDEEIEFILTSIAKYLHKRPGRGDVLSVYAGLRPLVKVGDVRSTAALSRDHTILISNSGLLTIAGGKWTTYRKMAQDTVDQAETMAGLDERPCRTSHLRIHGWTRQQIDEPNLRVYGADAASVRAIVREDHGRGEKLHPELPYIEAEIVWAVREEMARTVEDVLSRRTRALLLGARASIECAPRAARLIAAELGRDEGWERQAVEDYCKVARSYLVSGGPSASRLSPV
jgi:glycerol-3-phosphate dehydrogenase